MRITIVAALVIVLAACAGPPTTSIAGTPQAGGPAIVRAHALKLKVFTAGQTQGFPANAGANDLAAATDGSIWFTDPATPAIGRIATDGTVTEFSAGLPPGSLPYSIVAAPEGNMWFSDYRGVALGEVTPQGSITEFDASQYTDSSAMGIALAGSNEPYIVGFGSQPLLAHLTSQGTITAQLLAPGLTPVGALAADAQGDLFFVVSDAKTQGELFEQRANHQNFTRTPLHMKMERVPCCPNVAPKSLAVGSDGDPWFTTLGFGYRDSPAQFLVTVKNGKAHRIRIHHKGLSEVAIPSGIAAAHDGFWIAGGDPFQDNGALWHVAANGKQSAYDLPYDPLGLAVDAAGNPWFTASFSGAPARIVEVLR